MDLSCYNQRLQDIRRLQLLAPSIYQVAEVASFGRMVGIRLTTEEIHSTTLSATLTGLRDQYGFGARLCLGEVAPGIIGFD